MSLQSWLIRRVGEEDYKAEPFGRNGLTIARPGRDETVLAFAPDPDPEPFGLADLEQALGEYPGCEVIVLIKRHAGPGVVESAQTRGVVVGTMRHLYRAVDRDGPAGEFEHDDDRYLRLRLCRHRSVSKAVRIGMHAWRIERTNGLPVLTIIRHGRYEFPLAELMDLLEQHPGIEPDAFVITNPNASGLSRRVLDASAQLGIPVLLLDDLLARLDARDIAS